MICLFLPEECSFVVNSEANKKWYCKLTRMTTETYVVDPFNAMSLKNLIKSLKNTSKSVVIFPEGALTRTGQLQQAFPGCYHIANKTGLPIVPIYLEGLMFSKATCITSFFAKQNSYRQLPSLLVNIFIVMKPVYQKKSMPNYI